MHDNYFQVAVDGSASIGGMKFDQLRNHDKVTVPYFAQPPRQTESRSGTSVVRELPPPDDTLDSVSTNATLRSTIH